MSDDELVRSYPDIDEIEARAQVAGLLPVDIVRDVVRIVTVGHLAGRGFLNDDCVLTGGMGLRLRGSPRFTRFDTDSSMAGRLDDIELSGKLRIDTDDLVVTPDPGDRWEHRVELTIAQPITFDAFFASVDPSTPLRDRFSFTVSQRGLNLTPDWLPLVSPYDGLTFTREIGVPVMHITEQAAEKIVGWAAASLAKHYLDLAWVGREHENEIERSQLETQVLEKLRVGAEAHRAAYEWLANLDDLVVPLYAESDYAGPLNPEGERRGAEIRFLGPSISWEEARALVRKTIIPKLFTLKNGG